MNDCGIGDVTQVIVLFAGQLVPGSLPAELKNSDGVACPKTEATEKTTNNDNTTIDRDFLGIWEDKLAGAIKDSSTKVRWDY
ncbi:MAG: hypothetical protein ACRDF4_10540 [Rhabdochlamydiaceae bacterium]